MLMASKAEAPAFVFPVPTQGQGSILHLTAVRGLKHFPVEKNKNSKNVMR